MAKRKSPTTPPGSEVNDYRFKQAKRKNNPPAGIAGEGEVQALPQAQYFYNPHLPPVLRVDATGRADALPELLKKARQGPLSEAEAQILGDALRRHEPWLEWTSKRESDAFRTLSVDPVALHIHERVSTQAILKAAARQDVARSLFADPEQEYHQAVQFYRHDIDWANRLILGDSLQVMSSLAKREDLAGKVQMIYMDPPYGIRFASNFQPEVGKRDVKDKEQDLTREPEMVRAYRDTWNLGVHSYLSYLRDRLIVAKELLADTASVFVQISDENLHHVRELMDDVFGPTNFVAQIVFAKTSGATSEHIASTTDFIIWFARNRNALKYKSVFDPKVTATEIQGPYSWVQEVNGHRSRTSNVANVDGDRSSNIAIFRLDNLQSQSIGRQKGEGAACWFPIEVDGTEWRPGAQSRWKTNADGMARLKSAGRLAATSGGAYYVRFLEDFPVKTLSNSWGDTGIAGFASSKVYVVETSQKVIERCMLMTTDPGDLVLDPTCGSGTTAFVAEEWGRRWITIDTSRVAVAIARQRLLTAKFDYYRLRAVAPEDAARNPRGTWLTDPAEAIKGPATFQCKTVPHITLKSIAQNAALDPIFARHEPILNEKLAACNAALAKVGPDLRRKLEAKLEAKQRQEGARSVTDADRRRWLLPATPAPGTGTAGTSAAPSPGLTPVPPATSAKSQIPNPKSQILPSPGTPGTPAPGRWDHWQVPFDADPDYPLDLREGVTEYRAAWRAKMDEVNRTINASAEQEELVDQPEVVKNVVRVSGPFTVEAVQPPEMSLGEPLSGTGLPPGVWRGTGLPPGGSDLSQADPQFAGAPEDAGPTFQAREVRLGESPANVAAYLDQMVRFLRLDGVRFPNNKQMHFTRLEPIYESGSAGGLHAEGRWEPVAKYGVANGASDAAAKSEDTGRKAGATGAADADGPNTVAVVFGPQYGAITAKQVVVVSRLVYRRNYTDLVFAGFSFDAAAQAEIQQFANPKLNVHLAHIRPDINPGMNGLLKEPAKPGSGQLFTVFGLPRTRIDPSPQNGAMGQPEFVVTMEGVDIYNPVDNSVSATGADKVAAWFLDSDYDGQTFCITQAFFPDRTAWEKLARALGGKGDGEGVLDQEKFDALSGTVSLPFVAGKHKRVAVKVIDPRGNEVMSVHGL